MVIHSALAPRVSHISFVFNHTQYQVLGVACVCVETAKHPLIFRPLDERQSCELGSWMSVIRNAVAPPKPGSLDPLGELAVLMKRKDLTALEAQRAQMLMKDHGMIHKQGGSVKLVASIPLATCSLYPPLASEAITAYSGSE